MYRTMKYWGKKPHNVWRDLICTYSKEGDLVFDPFAGSSLTFFECVKTGRIPVISDINPLSRFLVDVFSESYDFKMIEDNLEKIYQRISELKDYQLNYTHKCSNCGVITNIYNYRWKNNSNIGYSYRCESCHSTITEEVESVEYNMDCHKWLPEFDLTSLNSVNLRTINKFGGSNITNLWSNRNAQILAEIFDMIIHIDEPYRKLFTLAFLETVHLTTKMCALRSNLSNRPLSTSWGRPAYMALSNWMEQNPLIQFKRSFTANSGLVSALRNRDTYIKKYKYSSFLSDIGNKEFSGFAFTADSKELDIDVQVDMIIADPPYGDIVQYGELSLIWNVWLEKAYPDYSYDLSQEIIINSAKDYNKFESDMTEVLSKCFRILSETGVMILTYNSNNIEDWYSINNAINKSGFNIEDFYLQRNLRSSEANVSSKEGISISDYYLKLTKTGPCISDSMIEELVGDLKKRKK